MTNSPGPPFIGLTGAIGAGKSEALAAFNRLGAATLSADEIVHELLTGEELAGLIAERLGSATVVDGRVDRTAVADAVFGDEPARKWLEQVLWPRVGQRIWDWRMEQEAASNPPCAMVVEVPLLFESGMDQAFDLTIVIAADDSIRLARAHARAQAAVDEREALQMPAAEKAARADRVVVNDGTTRDLELALSALLRDYAGRDTHPDTDG